MFGFRGFFFCHRATPFCHKSSNGKYSGFVRLIQLNPFHLPSFWFSKTSGGSSSSFKLLRQKHLLQYVKLQMSLCPSRYRLCNFTQQDHSMKQPIFTLICVLRPFKGKRWMCEAYCLRNRKMQRTDGDLTSEEVRYDSAFCFILKAGLIANTKIPSELR